MGVKRLGQRAAESFQANRIPHNTNLAQRIITTGDHHLAAAAADQVIGMAQRVGPGGAGIGNDRGGCGQGKGAGQQSGLLRDEIFDGQCQLAAPGAAGPGGLSVILLAVSHRAGGRAKDDFQGGGGVGGGESGLLPAPRWRRAVTFFRRVPCAECWARLRWLAGKASGRSASPAICATWRETSNHRDRPQGHPPGAEAGGIRLPAARPMAVRIPTPVTTTSSAAGGANGRKELAAMGMARDACRAG